MRGQPRTIMLLIGLMCLIRFSLGAAGYVSPEFLMEEFGATLEDNLQMPYVIRVWAIRDVVLAVLVATSSAASALPLLLGCIVIDTFDIVTALLSGLSGAYDFEQSLSLMTTAILALIPETIAVVLIFQRRKQKNQSTHP